jgi:hypothetical protein
MFGVDVWPESLESLINLSLIRRYSPASCAAVTLLATTMTSPILRILGAVAGLGSAILCWFLGSTLAVPLRRGTLFSQGSSQYILLAFLSVPALVLAVVALFWVPPRVSGGGPLPEGRRWRLALVLLFMAAFVIGLVR